MLDLYKQLNVPEDASPEAIQQALARSQGAVRSAAQTILLDPRRRVVYDRNRRLLLAIGQLRSDLGLNYTRFWSRREFNDFLKSPVFAPASPPASAGRRVDKMMIAGAFHAARTVSHHGRRHAARWGGWWVVALAIGVVAMLLIFWSLRV
jgi:hypothetical protein